MQNVITRFGDGGEGWREQAPFDRIMVTAAMDEAPAALFAQLKPRGVMVAPIGRGPVQSLMRYVGDGRGGFHAETMTQVRFRAPPGRGGAGALTVRRDVSAFDGARRLGVRTAVWGVGGRLIREPTEP